MLNLKTIKIDNLYIQVKNKDHILFNNNNNHKDNNNKLYFSLLVSNNIRQMMLNHLFSNLN